LTQPASDLAARFPTRWLRHYARSKLATDPVYEAVAARLPELPLLDVGCGIGLLALYLRTRGFRAPVTGIDFDAAKIAAAPRLHDVQFRVADARQPLDFRGSVAILDVLHYFSDADQQRILANAACCVAPGGVAIIRDAVRDGSWRYRATYLAETFATAIGWLKGERLHFPRRETITGVFPDAEIVPLWGRTPFNNYLFVFRAPSSGITNV
jgi:2-polyprenyl-3-methyl-5-hydroxy-6-metoxy-1,4-benzoquinol methylase